MPMERRVHQEVKTKKKGKIPRWRDEKKKLMGGTGGHCC